MGSGGLKPVVGSLGKFPVGSLGKEAGDLLQIILKRYTVKEEAKQHCDNLL